jgi:26S proteasome regulatory subunit N2
MTPIPLSILQMPKLELRCNAWPSLFAYPPPLEDGKKAETEKVETAVLSTTAKKTKAAAGAGAKDAEAKAPAAGAAGETAANGLLLLIHLCFFNLIFKRKYF